MITEEEKKERRNEAQKRYAIKNKEKIKKYRESVKENDKEYQKKYKDENFDTLKTYKNSWYEKNKERLKIKNKEYREANKDKIKHTDKAYREANKDKIRNQKRSYKQNKFATDPFFKIMSNIRTRTGHAIKRYNLSKNSSTMKMLGCDKNTLMDHLQKTGELYDSNFNVYDYDSNFYHIDHKKTFADVQKGIYTIEEVSHYTNLQILPADINLLKGGTSW